MTPADRLNLCPIGDMRFAKVGALPTGFAGCNKNAPF